MADQHLPKCLAEMVLEYYNPWAVAWASVWSNGPGLSLKRLVMDAGYTMGPTHWCDVQNTKPGSLRWWDFDYIPSSLVQSILLVCNAPSLPVSVDQLLMRNRWALREKGLGWKVAMRAEIHRAHIERIARRVDSVRTYALVPRDERIRPARRCTIEVLPI
jgi:hypothetical protein